MIELPAADLWTFHPHNPIVITTNGCIRQDGACVMGRGVAREAALRFQGLPYDLGAAIKQEGNRVYRWIAYNLITFPVKYHFADAADLDLIEKSAQQLVEIADRYRLPRVYLTRVGCGNGRLTWGVVKKRLTVLDDRFYVVDKKAMPF